MLKWCHVSLPTETVESERFYVYSIAGMGCRLNYKDHVTLVLESDEPLTPENIDLGVAVEVVGNEGVYFYQAGYLNAYLEPAFATRFESPPVY